MWCWNVIADSVAIPSILSASSLHSSYPISASGKTLVTGHTESVTSTSQLRVCPLPLVAAMQSNHAHHWSCWKPRLLSAHGPWVPTSHGSSQASRLEFAISLLFTPMSMAWPGAHVFQCKPWIKWCINQFSPCTTKGSPSQQRNVGRYPGRASRGNLLQRHVAYVTALTDHCLLKHAVSPHGCAQPWDWRKW